MRESHWIVKKDLVRFFLFSRPPVSERRSSGDLVELFGKVGGAGEAAGQRDVGHAAVGGGQ